MNLMINGLPKVSFKAAAAVSAQPAQQLQPMPQVKQDTFEKSDKAPDIRRQVYFMWLTCMEK